MAPILDERGKLLGKINVLDFISGGVIVLAVLGFFMVQSGYHVTSGEVIEGESDVEITVQVSDLKTLDPNLFKPGEQTAITIRNQPRGTVEVVSAQSQPVQVTALNSQGQPTGVKDYSEPNGYDLFIKLKDHAMVTRDGYVANGVKIKIGLPIELEGFKYRVYGRITDVNAIE